MCEEEGLVLGVSCADERVAPGEVGLKDRDPASSAPSLIVEIVTHWSEAHVGARLRLELPVSEG